MTGANVFDMTAAGAGQALNTNAATSRNRAEDASTAGLFATMLGAGQSSASDAADAQNMPEAGTDTVQTDAYDRFQYRETEIRQAGTPDMAEKLAGAEEKLDEFAGQVVAGAARDLGVTEEEVLAALEVLGLTTIDLIEPQNLVELTLEITGGEEPSELLVNSEFMGLLEDVESFAGQLLEELDIPAEQVDDFIMYADNEILPPIQPDPDVEDIPEYEADPEDLMGDEIEMIEVSEEDAVDWEWPEDELEPVQTVTAETVQAAVQATEQVMEQEAEPVKAEEAEETEMPAESVQTQTVTPAALKGVKPEADDEPREDRPRQDDSNRTPIREAMSGAQVTIQDTVAMPVKAQPVDDSYLSIDTMDLIQQVAEKIRVSIAENETSMELQLNPEHLGKVYMQVTAKEGAVSAQIAAANEAVRNALEMQMIELKENLNQAGVKVEAIEVTVASHEFEQNLEQNSRREEQEGEYAEILSRRRSIRLDSLDELVGLMTEEEALAAQIMRENGNTMDLTV